MSADERNTFDRFIGMQGRADGSSFIDIEPHHCNPTGAINGAVMISMADNVSTGVANRAYFEKFGEQKFLVGVDLHAVMLSNQQGGRIVARGSVVRVGRRITVIRTSILGADDKVLAEVTSTHVPT